MENPGLKRHTPDEPFIKVTHRRLAAPPPMATPYTGQGTNGGQVVPNEPPTVRSNPMTPPPLAATPVTPGPNATNGAPPILRLNDVASTPRMGDDPASQAANQRRKTVQQGDGTKENPAYDAAQRRVQDQLERRRTHALHQGVKTADRIQQYRQIPDIDTWLDSDFPPHGTGALRPMIEWKDDEENPHFEKSTTPGYRNGPACETCYLHGGGDVTPLEHDRFVKAMNKDEELIPPHEFTPHQRPTRFSAFNPERGEWEYDLDDPHYFLHDPAPSSDPDLSYTPQPMVAEFLNHPEYEPHDFDEEGYINPGSEKAHGADYSETYYQRGQRAQLEHENPGMRMLAAFDTNPAAIRGEIVPSGGYELDNLMHFKDYQHRPRLSDDPNHTEQPMIDFKRDIHTDSEGNPIMDEPYTPNPPGGCETCWLQSGYLNTKFLHDRGMTDHDFTPFPPQARLAAQVPHEDPIYPYRPQERPEEDTVDLDNLQSGDDTYSNRLRPEDRPASTNELLDRVFGPSTGEESAEHEQAARAHEQALNMMKGLPSARHDLQAVDLPEELGLDRTEAEDVAGRVNDMMDRVVGPSDKVDPTTGLTQAQMSGVDNYVKGLKNTHKQHVKEQLDDWLARGGKKTGEPRPVERFSAKYGLQRIVPMEGNPFPELNSPIYPVGKCEGCGTKLYDSEDSSGDPRGALGEHTVGTLDAREYDATDGPHEGDRRMHGPSALICPQCDASDVRQERILDKYRGHKAGDMAAGGRWTKDENGRQKFVPYRYTEDKKGIWHNPGEQVGNCPQCDAGETGFYRMAAWSEFLRTGDVILSDRVDLIRTAESDEEFWQRMEQEYPGQQPRHMHSEDASTEQFPDEDDYRDPSYEDPDMEDVIPENMSLRDHANLIRPVTVEWNGQPWHHPTYRWDGELRYPKYTKQFSREIRDSDDQPGHADEYHAIEHNTHQPHPVLPTEDNPEPHVLEYPWAHTYGPAATGDEGTLTAGYNTADQAMHAVNQLSIWGPRHPESQKLLKRYRYVDSEEPYDPSVELPHEKAQRMGRAR